MVVFIAADNKESNRNAKVVREARLIGRGYRIPGARSFTRELVSISLFHSPFSSFLRAAFTSVPDDRRPWRARKTCAGCSSEPSHRLEGPIIRNRTIARYRGRDLIITIINISNMKDILRGKNKKIIKDKTRKQLDSLEIFATS